MSDGSNINTGTINNIIDHLTNWEPKRTVHLIHIKKEHLKTKCDKRVENNTVLYFWIFDFVEKHSGIQRSQNNNLL